MDRIIDIDFEAVQEYIDLELIEMFEYAESAADLDAQYYGEHY